MTQSIQSLQAASAQDAFARRITARLTAGCDDLPYDISERLRAARVQALERRKVQIEWQPARAAVVAASGSTATLGNPGGGWLRRLLASTVPLMALLAGLVVINVVRDEDRMQEITEVDAALLADDLPPAAYADAGFLQFLKAGGAQQR